MCRLPKFEPAMSWVLADKVKIKTLKIGDRFLPSTGEVMRVTKIDGIGCYWGRAECTGHIDVWHYNAMVEALDP